jgi:flavodoxin
MNEAIIHWSKTGNTEKVALVIMVCFESNGIRAG